MSYFLPNYTVLLSKVNSNRSVKQNGVRNVCIYELGRVVNFFFLSGVHGVFCIFFFFFSVQTLLPTCSSCAVQGFGEDPAAAVHGGQSPVFLLGRGQASAQCLVG